MAVMQARDTQQIGSLIKIQLLVLAFATLLLLPFGLAVLVSGFLGGLISLGSSIVMAMLVFRKYRAQQPEKIVANFYSAEITKLLFTIGSFALVIKTYDQVNIIALVVIYFVIQVLPAMLQAFAGNRG